MKNQRTIYLSLVLALLLGALMVLLLRGSTPVSAEQAQNSPADAAPPVAGFTHSAPDEWGTSTVFTNTTTVSGTVSYFWEFGDGGTSIETDPTHVYPMTGIYTVTLTAKNAGGTSVAAELVVVYGSVFPTSQTGFTGKLGKVSLSLYGPKQTPSYGDAYSCPKAHVSGQPATYDPTSDPSAPDNPNRADFQDWRGYPFRIHIPADVTGTVRVEILDPETYNRPNAAVFITDTLPVTTTTGFWHTPTGRQVHPYVYHWFDSSLGGYRYWFVRMDENRRYNNTPPSYSDAYNTTTEFRLYYIARQPDGSLERVYIATYTGQPDNSHDTDLKWVCPGGSASQDPQVGTIGYNGFPASFEVDVDSLSDITTHDDGSRSLYLEVEGVDGWSENDFDLWVGPATPENLAVPADVNARNLWIDRQYAMGVPEPHDAAGIAIYSDGALSLSINTGTVFTSTLAYIPDHMDDNALRIYHWDNDVGTVGICYRFKVYPVWGMEGTTCDAGEVEGALSGGNSWTPPPEGYDWVPVSSIWWGDYLEARYHAGMHDNSTWRLTLDLDTTPPWSEVEMLPTYQITTTFHVSWDGDDWDLRYDVQYRDGAGGTWTDWLINSEHMGEEFNGEDGHTYYFRSRGRDNEGNVEAYPAGDGDTHTTVDATPPVGSLAIDGGAEATADLSVTLTISATDTTSGLALMQFSDDGVSFSSWETYTTTKAWTLPGGDGPKTVYVRFQDNASNTSSAYVDTIILDTAPPWSAVDVLPAYQITTLFSVSWSGDDVSSSTLYYDVQYRDSAGGTWTDWLTDTVDTEASFSSEDGHTYYFRSRARDGAGNAEAYPAGDGDAHTTVDATPPVGSLAIDSDAEATTDLTVTLTISATDSTSGLALMQFSDDGASFSSWETYATTKEWTLTGGDGTKTVYVRFQDNASNTSPAYVDTIILDTTAPTGSILIEGGTEVVPITQVTLTLSATDAYTVTEMRLRNDAEAWGSWEPYDTSRAWTLPDQNGEHTVWVQFRDQFGNVSLAYADSIIYQPPIYLPLVMREDW